MSLFLFRDLVGPFYSKGLSSRPTPVCVFSANGARSAIASLVPPPLIEILFPFFLGQNVSFLLVGAATSLVTAEATLLEDTPLFVFFPPVPATPPLF